MLQFGNESLGKGIDDFGKNHGRGCVVEILTNPMKYKHWLETFKVNEQKQEEDAEQDKNLECAFDELMKIASLANFFHTGDKQSYADITVNEHMETYSLNSRDFKHWLNNQFFLKFNQIPSEYEMAKVLNALEGKALFQGEYREIHNRLAFHDDKIYIDLGCPDWKVVEVSSNGWKIVSDYPVRFKRSQNQQSLPIPTRNGNVNELREIVNFDDADWVLILCWLSFCYYPKYPHPILILNGEQGSGKSFTSSVFSRLIDPNKSPLLPEPKNTHDLAITALNRWLICFDNFSGIKNDLSDALCRISTGGGFATRTLYQNDEETVFRFIRPMIVNGIDSLANRSGEHLSYALSINA